MTDEQQEEERRKRQESLKDAEKELSESSGG